MKRILLSAALLIFISTLHAQTKEVVAVEKVLKGYQSKLEKLDTAGITKLFASGAKVYEGGSDEGSIQNYLNHHLAPELKGFKSFDFSDYKVDVKVVGDYAYTAETYIYTIVLAKDNSQIKSKGVATSVLKKTNGEWKIEMTHSSFRRAK